MSPRRMDIELTSQTPDGGWTWRAAGARQPKGSLDGSLVPAGEKVGSVLRAEIEVTIEGIDVLSLDAVVAKHSEVKTEGRIEVVGTPKRAPDVSVILAPSTGKRPRRRDDDGEDRRGGGGGGRGGRGDRDRRGPREDGDRAGGRGPRSGVAASGAESGSGSESGSGRDRSRDGGGEESRPPRGPAGPRRPGGRNDRPSGRGERPTVPTSTVHRNAMLATLRPEQIPVAEQLLRGGLPAVRQAIEAQNKEARTAGKPPASNDALLAMADELLPIVKLADWKDRAAAAQSAGKEYRLRDLRAVVAASRTVILDEDGRGMAKALHDALDQRTTALKEEWLARITNALNDGRVLQAVEASIRPPEPGTRCPADLAVRLAASAGEAMSAELAPEDWLKLLDAVVASPVRRTVKPVGIPDDEVAKQAARHASGSVPALAKLLGLRIPPPPPRVTERQRITASGG